MGRLTGRAAALAMAVIAASPALAQDAAALAAGDPAKGAQVFKKCLACHSVDPGAPSKVGPNLHDVVGRTTGTYPGFKFSPVLVEAGASGHVWTPEEIAKFVENPKGVFPGTKMTFAGLKKPEERADVVAFLVSLNPAAAGAAPATAPADAPASAPADAPAAAPAN